MWKIEVEQFEILMSQEYGAPIHWYFSLEIFCCFLSLAEMLCCMWILKIPLWSPVVKIVFFSFKTARNKPAFVLSKITFVCNYAFYLCNRTHNQNHERWVCTVQSVCLQGCAQLCSPALPVNRGCSPHGDVALCSEDGCVMLETEIGMKLENLELVVF